MASIGPVTLSLYDQPSGDVAVNVGYTMTQSHHDAQHEQEYREVVELIGDDTAVGPGEDNVDEVIPDGRIWDGTVKFTTTQPEFTVNREATLPASAFDEDRSVSGTRLDADEIRARVTLTPLPAIASRESNLVRRQEAAPFEA
jgi:hypothetical protein